MERKSGILGRYHYHMTVKGAPGFVVAPGIIDDNVLDLLTALVSTGFGTMVGRRAGIYALWLDSVETVRTYLHKHAPSSFLVSSFFGLGADCLSCLIGLLPIRCLSPPAPSLYGTAGKYIQVDQYGTKSWDKESESCSSI